MSKLFEPLSVRELHLRNRVFLSPMCQYSATDGFPTDWHFVHYGARAVGGVGLVMVEATAVAPEGRITPHDLGIWSDAHGQALAALARFARASGAAAGIQLAHAGRKGSCDVPWRGGGRLPRDRGGWTTPAPSPVPFHPDDPLAEELAASALPGLVAAYESAARRALDAGFQVVEIHMAHGYLLHAFLSPLSNRRRDSFGGSWENRARFPLDVVRAVRAVWPASLPVFVRLSVTDWVEGGWDPEQSVRLARELKAAGVDLVDCSSGGLVPDAKIPDAPGYQVPFAARVRAGARIATGAVGRITDSAQAEEIVAGGSADAVSLGRELLRNPCWPLHAAAALGAQGAWPDPYLRARPV